MVTSAHLGDLSNASCSVTAHLSLQSCTQGDHGSFSSAPLMTAWITQPIQACPQGPKTTQATIS